MADFRLGADAERFFKHVSGSPPFNTKFDVYYLCVLFGLAGRRRAAPTAATGFVDHFVEEYRSVELLVVGLLLRAELAKLGLRVDDRDEVRQILGELVTTSGLSSEGVARLNGYAAGGFDVLREKYGAEPPHSCEEFLPRYVEMLHEVAADDPTWADAPVESPT